jgi:hypothetical protein
VITVEAALSDLDKLITEAEEKGDISTKLRLQGQKIVIKFLSTMRTNQLYTETEKQVMAEERKKRQKKA